MMFRPMRRFKQALSDDECLAVLRSVPRGVLSVLGDDGYPYGLPIDFFYDGESGHIFFHGAKSGHKLDAIERCDKVSLCVFDDGFKKNGEWALNIKSVIIFGRIRRVTDSDLSAFICRALCRRFTNDESYAEHEIAAFLPNVQCLELTPEHMSGKLVNES